MSECTPDCRPITNPCSAQPPAAPEPDVSAWVAELTEAHRDSYPMGNIHHGTPENPNWGTFCVECKQSWPCDVSLLLERVRVVEGERDAARREERMRAEDHARAWREVAAAEARAESAEAAHRALQAIAEDIAYQHAATIDGEFGCCHDEDALRAGGRVPEFDGDEFEPIPDDCPGKQTLDRHLDRIAASGGAR